MIKKKIALIILVVLTGIFCYPILFLATGSIMGTGELKENLLPMLAEKAKGYMSWRIIPVYPTFKFYVELLLDSPAFFIMFWNSVKLTAGILLGQLLVGVPAAWGLARYDFPFKRAFLIIYVILMMMPFQVTMLSGYLILDKFHLIDTHTGIIVPAAFSTFPVFIMYRFFIGIPKEVIESAKIDSANDMQIFVYIGLPLGSAGIISAMILGFLEYWNLIEQPLTFLRTQSLWPLSLYLPNITLENAGIAFVSSMAALIPAIFVFLSGQDFLERGIVAAAVKG